jgi:hypothetical protein
MGESLCHRRRAISAGSRKTGMWLINLQKYLCVHCADICYNNILILVKVQKNYYFDARLNYLSHVGPADMLLAVLVISNQRTQNKLRLW